MIPQFYLYTSPEVLAVPGTILLNPSTISANSTTISLFSVPSLEPLTQRAVVSIMMNGALLQTRVFSDGEVFQYSSALYVAADPQLVAGNIYLRETAGNAQEARRLVITRRLNEPDFNVVALPDGVLPGNLTGKRVQILDDALLRLPVREVVRTFASVFANSSTVTAPGIAVFNGFSTTQVTNSANITIPQATPLSLIGNLPTLMEGSLWQQPVKMTSQSWAVFGVLWGLLALGFLSAVGVAYQWYITQYL